MRLPSTVAVSTLSAGVIAFGYVLYLGVHPAEARPNYKKVFEKKYDSIKFANCTICHEDSKPKKIRNAFGQAVERQLGQMKVENEQQIKDALERACKEDSKVKGKTFGDLIKGGKYPAGNDPK